LVQPGMVTWRRQGRAEWTSSDCLVSRPPPWVEGQAALPSCAELSLDCSQWSHVPCMCVLGWGVLARGRPGAWLGPRDRQR
jgi:hypothetical protein